MKIEIFETKTKHNGKCLEPDIPAGAKEKIIEMYCVYSADKKTAEIIVKYKDEKIKDNLILSLKPSARAAEILDKEKNKDEKEGKI